MTSALHHRERPDELLRITCSAISQFIHRLNHLLPLSGLTWKPCINATFPSQEFQLMWWHREILLAYVHINLSGRLEPIEEGATYGDLSKRSKLCLCSLFSKLSLFFYGWFVLIHAHLLPFQYYKQKKKMEDKPILWNTMNCSTTVRSCMV